MVFFKKAIDYSPTWGIPWSNLALAYLNHGQMDSALYYGKEAVRLAPWNVIAMNTLGMVYGEIGQLDDSEKWISQAIALDVQYVQAQYNLACTKILQEEYQAALYWLERALQSGFDDWRLIELDTSLSPLREHPDFPALIAKYKR